MAGYLLLENWRRINGVSGGRTGSLTSSGKAIKRGCSGRNGSSGRRCAVCPSGRSQAYGQAVAFDLTPSCEDHVIEQSVDLQRKSYSYLHRDGQAAEDDFFSAEQNARL